MRRTAHARSLSQGSEAVPADVPAEPGVHAGRGCRPPLGIGANTAIFSVVNAVLLRRAFPDPDRLVVFLNTSPGGGGPGASPAKFQHWRSLDSVLQDVSVFRTGIVNYTGGSFPGATPIRTGVSGLLQAVRRARASRPHLHAAEDTPEGERVVVLSQRFWETRFNRADDAIGRSISLSGEPYTVVGVLGEFDFSDADQRRRCGCRSSCPRSRTTRATTSRRPGG